MSLGPEEQQRLLHLARKTLEAHLSRRPLPFAEDHPSSLRQKTGAFVTLHLGGELRGCIGHIISDNPLWQTVQRMAIAAATEDPRFEPVSFEELPSIDLEISVLTPFRQVKDLDEIQVGTHGLMITRGHHRGLLLPQVAREEGWNREEFLAHTCLKAGLSPEDWMDPSTKIEIFSAQVFGEKARP